MLKIKEIIIILYIACFNCYANKGMEQAEELLSMTSHTVNLHNIEQSQVKLPKKNDSNQQAQDLKKIQNKFDANLDKGIVGGENIQNELSPAKSSVASKEFEEIISSKKHIVIDKPHPGASKVNNKELEIITSDSDQISDEFEVIDFAESIANLSVLDEIANKNTAILGSHDNPSVFAGNAKYCQTTFGRKMQDCCRFKGILRNLIGGGCAKYKPLATAVVKSKRCHLVEKKYCVKKILGKCIKRKTAYCCYSSKLARIVQEIAHHQLNIYWGRGNFPNCNGLTAKQLSKLNFNTGFAKNKLQEFVVEQIAKSSNQEKLVKEKFAKADLEKITRKLQDNMSNKFKNKEMKKK